MSKFMLRREINNDGSFCHVVNFLVACEIMSLEDSIPMFKAFHSRGEDVLVDIPDKFDSRFREAMDTVKLR
jgi:hypothetical protein